MRGRGLEPPPLTGLAPKASVSAISPPAHLMRISSYNTTYLTNLLSINISNNRIKNQLLCMDHWCVQQDSNLRPIA